MGRKKAFRRKKLYFNRRRHVIFTFIYFKNYIFILGSSLLDNNDRAASRSSLDSHETESGIIDKIYRVVNIFKGANSTSEQSVVDAVSVSEINPVQSDYEEQENEESIKEQNEINFPQPESPSEYLRLLSRSESAGDANILDKLQQNKKNCSRTLYFNGDEKDNKNSPSKYVLLKRDLIFM